MGSGFGDIVHKGIVLLRHLRPVADVEWGGLVRHLFNAGNGDLGGLGEGKNGHAPKRE